ELSSRTARMRRTAASPRLTTAIRLNILVATVLHGLCTHRARVSKLHPNEEVKLTGPTFHVSCWRREREHVAVGSSWLAWACVFVVDPPGNIRGVRRTVSNRSPQLRPSVATVTSPWAKAPFG